MDTVETAAYLSVLQFNDGAIATCHVLPEMGCFPGFFTIQQVWEEDKEHVNASTRKDSEEEKRCRKLRRRRRKELKERVVDQESTTYEAGAF